MPKSATKMKIKLIVDIKPRAASPAQNQAYRRFWERLFSWAKKPTAKNKGKQLNG